MRKNRAGEPHLRRLYYLLGLILFIWVCVAISGFRSIQRSNANIEDATGTNTANKEKSAKKTAKSNNDNAYYHEAGTRLSYGKSNKLNGSATCDTVDVVYTWVNGTDPALIKVWEEAAGKKMTAAGMRRLRDYGILRFSVRSIEKYVPFARNIIFVTNGQVPSWYDDSPSAKHNGRIVTHRQIFPNPPTDLPTFNSNAIEANLRNIPGLPECVLYLNDDFFVGRPLKISDFVAKDGTLRLYMDGFKAPEKKAMKSNIWHRSIGRMNELINSHYHGGKEVRHNYAGHHCYFLRKSILDYIYSLWPSEFIATSARKFRDQMDTSLPFMHANIALEEGAGRSEFGEGGSGGSWTESHKNNVRVWERIKTSKPYCVCIQDGFGDAPNIDEEIEYLEKNLCELFPEKSSLEKDSEPNPCDKYKNSN